MIRLIAVAGLALSIAVSAQAMTPAPIVLQPDGMITKVAWLCGRGHDTGQWRLRVQEPPSVMPAGLSAGARPE